MNIARPGLSRPMDLAYVSNRFILIATPIIGSVAGLVALVRGETLWEAVGWGFSAGGSSFLAWTIARELHPDRAWVATVATALAPIGLIWGTSDLLASATVLLVARMVAGTTGLALRWADVGLLVAVGAPLVVRDTGPAALGVGALGLLMALGWETRPRGVTVLSAAIYAIGVAVSLVLADSLGLSDGGEWLLFWTGLGGGAIALLGPGVVGSVEDRGGTRGVRPVRVRAARFMALATAVAVSLTVSPSVIAPVWAALIAVAAWPR